MKNNAARNAAQHPFYPACGDTRAVCVSCGQPKSKHQTAKQAAYLFFLKHGACSYTPGKETKRQGYARQARQLAKAERDARALGYAFEWSDDRSIGSHVWEFGEKSSSEEPTTCERCVMRDSAGKVAQSLGCIDDASREYRRVIEAELALEELGEVKL